MEKSNLISIIVPVYKTEKYLDRCVKSMINQTYKNIEIVLVDDDSPDSCPQMCDAWAEKDNRIKVIHKRNGGAFSARLEGIKQANGSYIGFVDSDDWIDNDMYEYLFKLAERHSADIAHSNMRTISADGECSVENPETEQIQVFCFEDIMKNINTHSLWSVWNNLYKKELFDSLPTDLPTNLVFSEDMMMNYFLYKKANKMAVSNLLKYNYFRHSESAISGKLTYDIIDDSMLAYNIIDKDFDKSSPAYPYFVSLKITNDMFLLNSIIRNDLCRDRYKPLKKDIVKNIKYIFSKKCSNYFQFRHKTGVILLVICPKLYNKMILVRRSARGY